MTINEKLATVQTKFKSKKSRFNSFGKYYFRSAEDILEATKPFLLELGVSVTI
ncbi:MAG: recombinase, partial [Proteobacteria bacterium]|nr:recombinase [Pseudomonadota bacterium]